MRSYSLLTSAPLSILPQGRESASLKSPEAGHSEKSRHVGFTRLPLVFVIVALLFVCRAEAQPQRIVSTSPSITEVLFALGLRPRVVGVSNYCEYPPSVLSLPKVGTFLHPEPELIARLQPNLLIVHKLPNELTNRLAALHIPFAEVDRGAIQDTYSEILQMGKPRRLSRKRKVLSVVSRIV